MVSKVFIAVFLSILIISVAPAYAQNQTQNQTQTQSQTSMEWETYSDPILQFSIARPSTWEIDMRKDQVTFEIPDTHSNFHVVVEPISTSDHSEYAREKLNEERDRYSDVIGCDPFELLKLNETSINGQPATYAQFEGGCDTYLRYYMATDDYTGYELVYNPDFRDDNSNSTERGSTLKRMITSFNITE